MAQLAEEGGFWVFGYGSLIWKVDFPYEKRVMCYAKSLHRRFWQGSHDHRGTATAPGRVVTLISHEEYENHWRAKDPTCPQDWDDAGGERCYGVAFKLRDREVESVLEHLDLREVNGYTTATVAVFLGDDELLTHAHVYIGRTDNMAFLGPADTDAVARQMVHARGQSGRDIDYFLTLCGVTRLMRPQTEDVHLSCLEEAILRIAKEDGVAVPAGLDPAISTDIARLVAAGRTGLHEGE
ncbi:hypothetical protein HDU83_003007 [Entophlyctis luteolus]|nr:hypothetical protein HDU83_003007 [Entophlyctis luteolus]